MIIRKYVFWWLFENSSFLEIIVNAILKFYTLTVDVNFIVYSGIVAIKQGHKPGIGIEPNYKQRNGQF